MLMMMIMWRRCRRRVAIISNYKMARHKFEPALILLVQAPNYGFNAKCEIPYPMLQMLLVA